jgi:hypothetical protein
MKTRIKKGKRPVRGNTPEFLHYTDEQVRNILKTVVGLPGPSFVGELVTTPKTPEEFYLLRDKESVFESLHGFDSEWSELVPFEIVLQCIGQGHSRETRLPTDIECKKALARCLERIEATITDYVAGKGRRLINPKIVSLLQQAANLAAADLKRFSEKPLRSQSRLNAARPGIDDCLKEFVDVWLEIGGDLSKRKRVTAFLQAAAEPVFGKLSQKAIDIRLDRLGIFPQTNS